MNFSKKILNLLLIVAVYGIIQNLISLNILGDYYQVTLTTICINIILAVSLNLVTGFTGQFSLGHAGFMAIGAYACAIITRSYNSPVAFIIGVLAAAVSGCNNRHSCRYTHLKIKRRLSGYCHIRSCRDY